MKRCDVLYLIIGKNPMPNLISIATRINTIGEIKCFYTESTEKVFKQLKNVVLDKVENKKFNIEISGQKIVNINDINKVKEQLEGYIQIDEMSTDIIELNFTGGTKVLSSIAFQVFKEKSSYFMGTSILSYFDSENEVINSLFIVKGNGEKFKTYKYNELEDILDIKSDDIVRVHNINGIIKLKKAERNLLELTKLIFKEIMVSRKNAIEFINKFYETFKKESDKTTITKYKTLIEELFNEYHGTYITKEEDLYVDELSFEKMDKHERKQFLYAFKGFWFEYYIADILLQLKEEGVIKEVFSSVVKSRDDQEDFEVDLMIYNNFTLKCISVTSIEKYELAKFKLYEVKTRASQLAGDETRVAYINMCENSSDLIKEYKEIWTNELDNSLVIAYDNIKFCKELIKEWITKGD